MPDIDKADEMLPSQAKLILTLDFKWINVVLAENKMFWVDSKH